MIKTVLHLVQVLVLCLLFVYIGCEMQNVQSIQKEAAELKKRYVCYSCEPPDCSITVNCSGAVQCWKSRVRESNGRESVSRGCTTVLDQLPFMCKTLSFSSLQKRHVEGQYHISCCEGHLCNGGAFPELAVDDGEEGVLPLTLAIPALVVPALVATLFVVTAIAYLRRRHQRRLHTLRKKDQDTLCQEDLLRPTAAGDSTLREYLDHTLTSGSGSGLPLLIQRTLAKQISLLECIGKGRFGEVWRGVWHGDSVAVKIFFSRDEPSWTRETEIYSTVMLRHEAILGYIGSDMTSRNSCTQLWLVTHYHPLGSLFDYLHRTTLTGVQLLRLCTSLASGLAHLHGDVRGAGGKAPIAHRDLKTKNILVRVGGSCVVADLGLAVTQVHLPPAGARVGTKRYMSPELLDETLDTSNIEAFLRADIYALGLVLWEICRRVISNGIAEEYQPPFYDLVPSDPGFDEMRKVVCVLGQRPSVPNRWWGDPLLSPLASLMRECWNPDARKRLSALRVKKTLLKLAAINFNNSSDNDGLDALEVCV